MTERSEVINEELNMQVHTTCYLNVFTILESTVCAISINEIEIA